MLIYWQSYQKYLNFLHETKVHLGSFQRIRLRLEVGSAVVDRLAGTDSKSGLQIVAAKTICRHLL